MSKKVNIKESEDSLPIKTVRGTTGGPVNAGGSPVAYHTHDFRYEVITGHNGINRVVGITDYDPVSGSTHVITDFRYTTPSDDGHYHTLPVDTLNNSDQFPMPDKMDILGTMAKEEKEVAETVEGWMKNIIDEMKNHLGSSSAKQGRKSAFNANIPNPLIAPTSNSKKGKSAGKNKMAGYVVSGSTNKGM